MERTVMQRAGRQEGRKTRGLYNSYSEPDNFLGRRISLKFYKDPSLTAQDDASYFRVNNPSNSQLLHLSTVTILLMLLLLSPAFADDGVSLSALVTPQNVEFNACTRSYIITPEKLFYMAIAGINANRFTIDEIQSKTGYILFTAVNKQYLAAVVQIDSQKAMLKITPVNNNYFFAPGIVSNIFRYIDLNGATPMVTLSKM